MKKTHQTKPTFFGKLVARDHNHSIGLHTSFDLPPAIPYIYYECELNTPDGKTARFSICADVGNTIVGHIRQSGCTR